MRVQDKYWDVLQNIEFAIANLYKEERSLNDYNVMASLEALINRYSTEIKGSVPRSFKLSQPEQTLLERIKEICEWRLGRGDDTMKNHGVEGGEKTVEEIVLCLKKVLKSVKFWNREAGRQGYLDFVVKYFR